MLDKIYESMTEGDTLTLTMTKKAEGQVLVSILPSAKVKNLLPINVSGSIEEVASNIAGILEVPLQQTALIVNKGDFEKSLEKAKEETSQTKETKEPAQQPAKRGRKPGTASQPKAEQMTAKTSEVASAEEKKEAPATSPVNEMLNEIEANLSNKDFDYLGKMTAVQKLVEKGSGEEMKQWRTRIFDIKVKKAKADMNDLDTDEAEEVQIPQTEAKPAQIQPNPAVEEEAEEASEEASNDDDDF